MLHKSHKRSTTSRKIKTIGDQERPGTWIPHQRWCAAIQIRLSDGLYWPCDARGNIFGYLRLKLKMYPFVCRTPLWARHRYLAVTLVIKYLQKMGTRWFHSSGIPPRNMYLARWILLYEYLCSGSWSPDARGLGRSSYLPASSVTGSTMGFEGNCPYTVPLWEGGRATDAVRVSRHLRYQDLLWSN